MIIIIFKKGDYIIKKGCSKEHPNSYFNEETFNYAFPAAIKFKAEPATNQPIWLSL